MQMALQGAAVFFSETGGGRSYHHVYALDKLHFLFPYLSSVRMLTRLSSSQPYSYLQPFPEATVSGHGLAPVGT